MVMFVTSRLLMKLTSILRTAKCPHTSNGAISYVIDNQRSCWPAPVLFAINQVQNDDQRDV